MSKTSGVYLASSAGYSPREWGGTYQETGLKEELAAANRYFKSELEKRFRLVYKTQRHGHWHLMLPGEKLEDAKNFNVAQGRGWLGLSLRIYDPRPIMFTDSPAFRIRTHGRHPLMQGSSYDHLELSFLARESLTVIPWALDNLLKVKTIPDWLLNEHGDGEKQWSTFKVGEPLNQYAWTKEGWGVMDVMNKFYRDQTKEWEARTQARLQLLKTNPSVN